MAINDLQNDVPAIVVSRLAHVIDDIKHPKSRSCAIWLVGQYACPEIPYTGAPDEIAEWVPDVLRRACKSFAREVSVA